MPLSSFPIDDIAAQEPKDRTMLKSFLDTHEGYSPKAYVDNNGYTTIGHGFNLNEPSIRENLRLMGKDPEKLETGLDELDKEDADKLRDKLLDKNDKIMAHVMPAYSTLPDNEKAALASKYYQLPKNFVDIAPLASDPERKLDVMQAMLSQNIKNPGVVKRNLDTAKLYGGEDNFNSLSKVMPVETRNSLLDALNRIKNDNYREQALKEYGQFLNPMPAFPKINKLLRAE